MRHYEIVALVHPDQSEQQDEIIDRYRRIVEDSGGKVHRCEDWGRRKLAYPIQKLFKAGYFLMNIECEPQVKAEIENVFRYNDSIIRSLIIRMDGPVTEESPVLKKIIKKKAEEKEEAEREAAELARAREAEEARKAELAKKESEEKSKSSETESEEKADDSKKESAEESAQDETAATDVEQPTESSEETAESADEETPEQQTSSEDSVEDTEPTKESESESEEAKS